jgi:hypothetical protein
MHMTCAQCRNEFCWECLSSWRGSCSAPKVYHETMCLLNDDLWGQSLSTRMARKSVGLPLLCLAGCTVGSAALGAASLVAACCIASTPILAGVYLYKHPPATLRRLYYRWRSEVPAIAHLTLQDRLTHGVVISLPWRYDDPNYQSALTGMTSTGHPDGRPGLMGLQGRVSDSIFVAYLNHNSLPSFVAYFVPAACPEDHLGQLGIRPQEHLTTAYPSSSIPYSDYREEEDRVVLERMYANIRIAAALAF